MKREEDQSGANCVSVCDIHGETEHSRSRTGVRRCKKCRTEANKAHRRGTIKRLVDMFGGKCERCGYDRCVQALDFHHKPGFVKSFNVRSPGISFKGRVEEAMKCELICANCHREEHWLEDSSVPPRRPVGRPRRTPEQEEIISVLGSGLPMADCEWDELERMCREDELTYAAGREPANPS